MKVVLKETKVTKEKKEIKEIEETEETGEMPELEESMAQKEIEVRREIVVIEEKKVNVFSHS